MLHVITARMINTTCSATVKFPTKTRVLIMTLASASHVRSTTYQTDHHWHFVRSRHCDYNHPHTQKNAHNLYKITYHPFTLTLLHVSAIYHHPRGDINKNEYKIYTL